MKKLICLMIIAVHLSSCATYKSKSASFRQPKAYANYQNSYGVLIGAESFADSKQADEIFGADLRAAGLLPVQVVIDNKSGQAVEVVSGQTFLIDSSNRYWKVLSNREAVERMQKATDGGTSVSGAKGAVQGTATGTLQELAIGVVSGRDRGSLMVKPVASKVTSGAVAGSPGKAGDERQSESKTADALRDKGVEGKIMSAESLASGFIYFPGEIPSANELRLQVKFRGDGRLQTINLKLK